MHSSAPNLAALSDNHIEVDNRLSWFLGRLEQRYGHSAFYVHLTRNPDEVAESFVARWNSGIMHAYRTAISPTHNEPTVEVARDMIHTVTTNLDLFLRDKPDRISIQLEHARDQFSEFGVQSARRVTCSSDCRSSQSDTIRALADVILIRGCRVS
jgi:hypothetical protein